MRKSNKIMFKAVAILLSLVLLTSCVVSTTFAKYVIRKSTGPITMELEKFGVRLTMDISEELQTVVGVDENGNSNVIESKMGDSLSVTINNLKMMPGYDFSDAVTFSFLQEDGSYSVPKVPVRVSYDIAFSVNDSEQFVISKDNFPSGWFQSNTNSRYFIPANFSFSALGANDTVLHNHATNVFVVEGVASNLKNEVLSYTSWGGARVVNNSYEICYYDEFEPDQEVKFYCGSDSDAVEISKFQFGFKWPSSSFTDQRTFRDFTVEEINAIATWLVEHKNPACSITYTVKVEQIVE